MLTANALLTPKGRLNAQALWPSAGLDEVQGFIAEYLAEGYVKAAGVSEPDEAARQWAYYRAWDEAYQRMLLLPSTVSTSDEGSSSYLLTQMEHVGELAAEALAAFNAILVTAEVEGVDTFGVITSYR